MAATAGPKSGIDGAVYRNTGSYATPVWAEIDQIRDVTPGQGWDMGDASVRATRAKLYHKTQQDIAPQVVCRADDADAGYQALYDAAVHPTLTLDLLVLDGPLTREGSSGFRADFLVNASGGPTQGAGDVQYTTFDLRPGFAAAGQFPKIVDVGAASATTFTAV